MLVIAVLGLVWSKAQLLLCRDSFSPRQHQTLAPHQAMAKVWILHSYHRKCLLPLQTLLVDYSTSARPLPWQTLLIDCSTSAFPLCAWAGQTWFIGYSTEPRTPGRPYKSM